MQNSYAEDSTPNGTNNLTQIEKDKAKDPRIS